MIDWIMAPKVLISGICEFYLRWQKRFYRYYQVKDLEIRWLSWLNKWAQCNHKGTSKGDIRGPRVSRVGDVMAEAEAGVTHFEDRGRSHKPRNRSSHCKLKKARNFILPLRASRRNMPCDLLVQVNWFQTFGLQHCKTINLYHLKSLHF